MPISSAILHKLLFVRDKGIAKGINSKNAGRNYGEKRGGWRSRPRPALDPHSLPLVASASPVAISTLHLSYCLLSPHNISLLRIK